MYCMYLGEPSQPVLEVAASPRFQTVLDKHLAEALPDLDVAHLKMEHSKPARDNVG